MSDMQENIINAAGELFMALPYHEVTMDRVRGRVGVGKGTIYRHFDSKEDLYCRVVLYELDRLLESLRQVAATSGLRELCGGLARFFQEKKPLFALLRSEELRGSRAGKKLFGQWKERREDLAAVFEEAVRERMECGVYSDAIPAAVAARFLIAMLKSGFRGMERGRVKSDEIVEHALHLFEHGMGTGNSKFKAPDNK